LTLEHKRITLVYAFDTMKQPARLDLIQGTLDLLVLRTLQAAPMHGWAIAERIQQISGYVLRVNQGSLYPALHRLEHKGWINAEWGISELGRRARLYQLTPAGRTQLEMETNQWGQLSAAIGRVLEMA
jgi:PadR family transcriptional regulator PadR